MKYKFKKWETCDDALAIINKDEDRSSSLKLCKYYNIYYINANICDMPGSNWKPQNYQIKCE